MDTLGKALAMFLAKVEETGVGNSSFWLLHEPTRFDRIGILPGIERGHINVDIWSGRLGVSTLWQTHLPGGVPIDWAAIYS